LGTQGFDTPNTSSRTFDILLGLKKMYTRILVPYDISLQTGKGYDQAIRLAKAINGGKRFFL
jgi:hypothetical protein